MDLVCTFAAGGSDDTYASLADWINGDPQPDLRATTVRRRPQPDEMGSLPDHLLLVLGPSGAVSVVASVFKAWLMLRQAKGVRLQVTDPDHPERTIVLTFEEAHQDLVQAAFDRLLGPSTESDAAPGA
jgi:hypothetical protein